MAIKFCDHHVTIFHQHGITAGTSGTGETIR